MRKPGYQVLYNKETCVLTEPTQLIPEYIESQHSHKTFYRLCKERDEVK